jgi:hypothetical protein
MRNSVILSVAALTATLAFGETFKGTVKDSSDTPISGAMVLVHWDSAGSTVGLADNVGIRADLTIHAKDDGSFNVDLPPGFYDVFTAARAFTPTCRKVRIKPGNAVSVVLRMSADPLYTAEMGDRFDTAPRKR